MLSSIKEYFKNNNNKISIDTIAELLSEASGGLWEDISMNEDMFDKIVDNLVSNGAIIVDDLDDDTDDDDDNSGYDYDDYDDNETYAKDPAALADALQHARKALDMYLTNMIKENDEGKYILESDYDTAFDRAINDAFGKEGYKKLRNDIHTYGKVIDDLTGHGLDKVNKYGASFIDNGFNDFYKAYDNRTLKNIIGTLSDRLL